MIDLNIAANFQLTLFADKLILFMSDGKPTDGANRMEAQDEILRVIREENAKLNNSVVIQTYGIGQNEGTLLHIFTHHIGSTRVGNVFSFSVRMRDP